MGSPIKQAVNSFSREMTPDRWPIRFFNATKYYKRCVPSFNDVESPSWRSWGSIEWGKSRGPARIRSLMEIKCWWHTRRKNYCSCSFESSTSIVCLTIRSKKSTRVSEWKRAERVSDQYLRTSSRLASVNIKPQFPAIFSLTKWRLSLYLQVYVRWIAMQSYGEVILVFFTLSQCNFCDLVLTHKKSMV